MSKTAIAYELLAERAGRRGAIFSTLLRFRPTKSEHELLRKELDWQHRVFVADAIAHHYDIEVFIPPQFNNQFDERYSLFYADAPVVGKIPDLLFGNEFWEVKSYEGSFRPDGFTDMLYEAKKQSPNIIVLLRHDYNIEVLRRRAEGYKHSNNFNRAVKYKIERVLIADMAGNVYEV